MQAAFNFLSFEAYFFKNFRVRHKIDGRSGLFCFFEPGQKPVFQLDYGNAAFIAVMVDIAVAAYLYVHKYGQRVDDGRTDSVQSPARLVSRIIEFASRMQRRKYHARRGNAFCMHPDRNAAPVVFYRTRPVRF